MKHSDQIHEILKRVKVAHMSNVKWRKLFEACENFGEPIGGVRWKFIGSEDSFLCSICVSDCLIDDARFGDCDPSPYAKLKEIEWIEIPEKFDDPRSDAKRKLPEKRNDVLAIVCYLNSVGKFPIFKSEKGIRIVGYEW